MRDERGLYANPMSRGRIARWLIEETGCPHRVELVEYGPAVKAPAYLAINPMGKVPAMIRATAIDDALMPAKPRGA